jgi:hypothetical protein
MASGDPSKAVSIAEIPLVFKSLALIWDIKKS